ncbi:hypothetical protein [Clostridium sp. 'White wine YQ']|uniref:hypothetical protein n=1 Tax=Clostridium sp. 'White wine YQ' TaxID=3027474 RepID=UPI002365CBDE|nr:hypothetical protein [Clostridium sp. 'White wine YQ']MDD7795875.1 hypothetical protein [Clostridium sp. 'White wine YQ']
MNDRELLKILNSISYSEEEINDLENKAIEAKNSIGEDLYYVKNDKVLRKITFIELERKVKSLLKDNEEIKYKMIALQSYRQKEIFITDIGGMGARNTIYLGLFVTDIRIFVFKMDSTYNLLEEVYVKEISDIESFIDLWEKCSSIGFKFNVGIDIIARPYGEENEKILIEMIKYLREKTNAEFKPYKDEKIGLFLIIMGLIAVGAMLGIIIDNIKVVLDILKW